jgi:hypothetical protein
VRSSKSHLLRILGIIGAVILMGAGIATATEGGGSDVDCEDEAAVLELEECQDEEDLTGADEECETDDTVEGTETDDTVEGTEADEAAACDDDGNDDGNEDGNEDGNDDGNDDGNEADLEATEDDESTDEEGDGPEEGTHGFIVSQAAKDRSHDERCGNHGAYVSSVARGLDDCSVPPGLQRKMDLESEAEGDAEDGTEVEGTQIGPNGNGGGRPDHAGPPAGRGRG